MFAANFLKKIASLLLPAPKKHLQKHPKTHLNGQDDVGLRQTSIFLLHHPGALGSDLHPTAEETQDAAGHQAGTKPCQQKGDPDAEGEAAEMQQGATQSVHTAKGWEEKLEKDASSWRIGNLSIKNDETSGFTINNRDLIHEEWHLNGSKNWGSYTPHDKLNGENDDNHASKIQRIPK